MDSVGGVWRLTMSACNGCGYVCWGSCKGIETIALEGENK
jgi:hypothetical protein